MPIRRQPKNRCWCFTINNPTPSDLFGTRLMFRGAKYGIFGHELGENETPHIQGYVHLRSAVTFTRVKQFIPRAHIECAAAGDFSNQRYCSKGEDIYEVGEPTTQGERTDLQQTQNDLIEAIAQGGTPQEMAENFPILYLHYSRSIRDMCALRFSARTEKPEVLWIFGKAGVGKTRYVFDNYQDIYIKDGTPWWDNYTQNNVILIDDFDNMIPYRTLLRILDRYPYQGQVKGGYVQINSPNMVITCEHPPDYYWEGNEYDQVIRRLTSVIELK